MTTAIVNGQHYPAEQIAGGAAYELFSEVPAPGFLRMPTGSYHKFLPASEVAVDTSGETPLQVPLSRTMSWDRIQRLCQSRESDDLIKHVRASATIKRGTRMVKPLTLEGVVAVLKGQLAHGFCYREWDIAHLRTPTELSVLSGGSAEVGYVLRWRAVDPSDYQIPTGALVAGLAAMPAHDRVGAPVLGTGFAPSSSEIIPEWITADLAGLPLPAHAALIAYTPDGSEVVLFTHQPEQRGWLRMVGPQWRHLVPSFSDQEYVPLPRDGQLSRLVGTFRGEEYPAIADPVASSRGTQRSGVPQAAAGVDFEFRVLAMNRAARYPVETLVRRTRYARWRETVCTVLTEEGTWSRLRLCRPDPTNVAALGARCYERGVYEVWAPTAEISESGDVDMRYGLARD